MRGSIAVPLASQAASLTKQPCPAFENPYFQGMVNQIYQPCVGKKNNFVCYVQIWAYDDSKE